MRSRIHKRANRTNFKIEPIFLIKILLIVGLYIIFFLLLTHIVNGFSTNRNFEKGITAFAYKNQETIFEVSEITLYSSAGATSDNNNLGLNISQFTDISFNISNPKNKVIKSFEIKDIEFNPIPDARYSCF